MSNLSFDPSHRICSKLWKLFFCCWISLMHSKLIIHILYYLHLLNIIFVPYKIFQVKNKHIFYFHQNMTIHWQVSLLKLKIIRLLCTTICCSMTHGFIYETPKTYTYIAIGTLNQYWIEKINISANYMNWFHVKLTSFTKILRTSNSYLCTIFHTKCRYPLPTNVIIFHSTSYAATLPVLLSYKCKYRWTW